MEQARLERIAAENDRRQRRNVESIAVHLRNAQEYESKAAELSRL
jgi:hypothetical protein